MFLQEKYFGFLSIVSRWFYGRRVGVRYLTPTYPNWMFFDVHPVWYAKTYRTRGESLYVGKNTNQFAA